ncbi:Alpha/Beta hydrolase protein, partial [Thamnocephalis sphaerospora]
YAKFAGASYCLIDKMLKNWTCLGHCKDGTEGTELVLLDTDKLTDIKYYVAVNHRLRSIIVSIRGTLNLVNGVVDLAWVPLLYTDFPGAPSGTMAHSGFLVSALRIGSAIRKLLLEQANKYPSYSVDFTGHSLGGAVTQLVALNFAAHTPVPTSRVRVITFSTPRVGNPRFAETISLARFAAYSRVTFNNDPVPHLPTQNLFGFRFQHAAGEKYL